MLKKLLRNLDTLMVVSDRAQRAAMHSNASGIPRELLYEGGLEVRPSDLLSIFKLGRPSEVECSRYQVVQVDGEGDLRICEFEFVPAADIWRNAHGTRTRSDMDRWIGADEYRHAFAQAAKQRQTHRLGA